MSRQLSQNLPGALTGDQVLHLVVHTVIAQRHFTGRKVDDRPTIAGLPQFANRLRIIWNAARNDDPYADWFLLKISRTLSSSRQHIHLIQTELERHLADDVPLELPDAVSTHPVKLPLKFSTPYAHQAAYLIAEFDTLVRRVLSAAHHGALTDFDTQRHINAAGRTVRRTFLEPMRFRLCNVTRDEVQEVTENAKEAAKLMGPLPSDVLSGKTRAPYAPSPVGNTSIAKPWQRSRSVSTRRNQLTQSTFLRRSHRQSQKRNHARKSVHKLVF